MKKLTFLIFLSGFLLFRPFQMQSPGMLFPGDDYSYFAYSTALAFGEYPFFEKEAFDEFNVPPLSRAGVGIMAAPFVATFSAIDRITHHPIAVVRTKGNLTSSWALFGAVFAAAFYFWFGCYFLYQAVCFFFSPSLATLSVGLMALTQGTGLYVFRRPVFSHVYEFFLQACFLFLLIRQLFRKRPLCWALDKITYFQLVLLACFTLLVRQNGLLYALLFPTLIILAPNQETNMSDLLSLIRQKWKALSLTLLTSMFLYLAIKYFPWAFSPKKYEEVNATFESTSFIFQLEPPFFYFKRLWTLMVGLDWGLIFTAPGIILGAMALCFRDLPQKKTFRVVALPLLVNLYLAVIWKSQGSWYGYRYLVYSAIPVLIIPFAFLLQKIRRIPTKRFYALCLLWFLVPALSVLLFEATPNTLLEGVATEFGGFRVGNLDYQVKVWKILLTQPLYALISMLKGGTAYVIYVLLNLLGANNYLPAKFSQLYPEGFNWVLTVKAFLIYASPFFTHYALNTYYPHSKTDGRKCRKKVSI